MYVCVCVRACFCACASACACVCVDFVSRVHVHGPALELQRDCEMGLLHVPNNERLAKVNLRLLRLGSYYISASATSTALGQARAGIISSGGSKSKVLRPSAR